MPVRLHLQEQAVGCCLPTPVSDASPGGGWHHDFMVKRVTAGFVQRRNWQLKAAVCFCIHRQLLANPPFLGKCQKILGGYLTLFGDEGEHVIKSGMQCIVFYNYI